MQKTTLPADLGIDIQGNVQLYPYQSEQDVIKTKITLSRHTISFLRVGNKEVMGHGSLSKIGNEHFLVMKAGNCLMTEKTSNADRTYKSILLFFDDEMLLRFLEKHSLTSQEKQSPESYFIFEYDAFIQQFVSSLEALLALPESVQQKMLPTKFEEIMLYLVSRQDASFLNSILQKIDDRTSRLTTVVEHNKLSRLSLEELAFLCNMSISTFKREFFRQYQETPMKWFSEQRLTHTATLLRSQQKRPIDLYEEAGYNEFSNFIQAFKRRFGMTPKQYQSQD